MRFIVQIIPNYPRERYEKVYIIFYYQSHEKDSVEELFRYHYSLVSCAMVPNRKTVEAPVHVSQAGTRGDWNRGFDIFSGISFLLIQASETILSF